MLLPGWLKTDEVPAAGKDLYQRWHDNAHGVSHIAAYDLAMVLDFISEWLAIVVIRGGLAEASMLLLLVEDGIIDLVLHDPMDEPQYLTFARRS